MLKIVRGENDTVAAHQLGSRQLVDLGAEDHDARSKDDHFAVSDIETALTADDDLFVIDAFAHVFDVFAVKLLRHFTAKGYTVFIFGSSFEKFEHIITSLQGILAQIVRKINFFSKRTSILFQFVLQLIGYFERCERNGEISFD